MKFSIITPNFNGAKYLSEAILSILIQKGDFDIELIFVDNLSNDSSMNIINKYKELLNKKEYPIQCNSIEIKIISENDNGMYDAINKGFKIATGDIYAWLNCDDIYLPDAFEVIAAVFSKYKKIKWLKGITSYIDENSNLTRLGKSYLYCQDWIEKGVYGRKLYFLQQASIFWRPILWEKANGLDSKLKLAGDFGLWIKFAELSPLYSLNHNIACFRFRQGQLSEDKNNYYSECDSIITLSKKIEQRIDSYKKYRENIPDFFKPFLYFIILGYHRFYLIDIIINNNEKGFYKLKRFYNYDFGDSLY